MRRPLHIGQSPWSACPSGANCSRSSCRHQQDKDDRATEIECLDREVNVVLTQPSEEIEEEDLFAAALALPAAERDRYLKRACSTDMHSARASDTISLDAFGRRRNFHQRSPVADGASRIASAPIACSENLARGLRRCVSRRANSSGQAASCTESHQARDGHEGRDRALRSGTASPSTPGSSEHRKGIRCRRDDEGRPVLRHGTGSRDQNHGILRSKSPDRPGAIVTLHSGVPSDTACTSEGNHSPRHQAIECPCHDARRSAARKSHRLWNRQGDSRED